MNVLYMIQEGSVVDSHSPAEEFPSVMEPEDLLLYPQNQSRDSTIHHWKLICSLTPNFPENH